MKGHYPKQMFLANKSLTFNSCSQLCLTQVNSKVGFVAFLPRIWPANITHTGVLMSTIGVIWRRKNLVIKSFHSLRFPLDVNYTASQGSSCSSCTVRAEWCRPLRHPKYPSSTRPQHLAHDFWGTDPVPGITCVTVRKKRLWLFVFDLKAKGCLTMGKVPSRPSIF